MRNQPMPETAATDGAPRTATADADAISAPARKAEGAVERVLTSHGRKL